ncbi:YfcC family protein [Sporosalibacterium faouarense]|uniref:YfcC family protein n=1 Tax=Sporosalibacterium faouarense TaxID=516123 RepID=UPI00141CCD9C|nr:AbgT family transporter [Sporosalibacterium faouarense]MTI46640.1 putative basic amino acid antiporter YfcC [Bacillota bacterium]
MKARIPNTYVLLFIIILILGASSYIIPAGNFERQIDIETGIRYVVPDSYRTIERTPVSIFGLFKAIPEGMMKAGDIIIFVLLTGGSFGIINATGTINTLISNTAKKYVGKEKNIIPVVMIMFSLAGAVFGTAEEALPLYPMFITLALALGFDTITGVAMVLVGTGSGFVAGFLNPFTTGIAQGVSELPFFSGMFLRVIAYFIFVSTAIIYVYRYASKIRSKTGLNNVNNDNINFNIDNLPSISNRQIGVSLVIVLSLVFLLVGVIKWNFYVLEISTTFLMMGIVSGLVGGLKSGRIVSEFVKGASNLVYGALIIGLAKSISVVMEYGNIMDTIIFYLSKTISGLTPKISAVAMFITQSLINLFITSGSGQAAVTMPIMKTLADISGVTRQTAVLAFQFGDGFSNIISPTSGYFMAALAIGGIKWKQWAKWMAPLFIIWCVEGSILLIIASIIKYGPF